MLVMLVGVGGVIGIIGRRALGVIRGFLGLSTGLMGMLWLVGGMSNRIGIFIGVRALMMVPLLGVLWDREGKG